MPSASCPICGESYSCACSRRNQAQTREAIKQAIIESPLASSLAIAKRVGTTDKTVSSVRDEMLENSEIPNCDRPYQRKTSAPWMAGSGNPDREPDDFYTTPPVATSVLLEKETFEGLVWEPACGLGHISEVLEAQGCEVVSTDLVDRGFGQGGIDFLSERRSVANIVTNPPFNLSLAFARHALECASDKVAMLLPLYWLESMERHEFFTTSPLATVYVFSRRVSFLKSGKTSMHGGLPLAWFVWRQGHVGAASLDWVVPALETA